MKTTRMIMAFAILFSASVSYAQGSGKVTLKAEIESENENRDLQISVVDLTTKDLVQRDFVSDLYFCTLPLNGRFMIHFRKEGHPATRMTIDTNAPAGMSYYLTLKLNLRSTNTDLETGISQAAGKLTFDTALGNFMLSDNTGSGAGLVALTSVNATPEVAVF